MSDYERDVLKEGLGKHKIRPLLIEQTDGGSLLDVKSSNPLGLLVQKEWGDYLATYSQELFSLELKVDTTDMNTLALEMWSNLIVGNQYEYLRRGHTPGWFVTSRSSLLLYYWMSQDVLAVLPLYELQCWALDVGDNGVPNIERHQIGRDYGPQPQFPCRRPRCRQLNQTVFRSVPLPVLLRELRPRPVVTSVEQLYLPGHTPNLFAKEEEPGGLRPLSEIISPIVGRTLDRKRI